MGNTSTKERSDSPPERRHGSSRHHDRGNGESSSLGRLAGLSGGSTYSGSSRSRRDRNNNLENTLFGLGVSSREARERDREAEKVAREERRKQREIDRQKERERSLREDSLDGGFLVTQGVYTGVEDFKDRIVRSLMIQRRLMPFFKGLQDHEDDWTDAQLVAAVRGLPDPGPDALPPKEELAPPRKPAPATMKTSSLTVPLQSRSRSASCGSQASYNSTDGLSSPTRLRSRTLASISAPKNPTPPTKTEPTVFNDPSKFVDGRPIEAYLYEKAMECPICFLYYPPFMNKTRCCDQEICSECFVQIKRPDPHPPENHGDGPPPDQTEPSYAEQLMCEPATCPFCKQVDFGVTYAPPPFRRGLMYQDSPGSTSGTSSCTDLLGSLNVPGAPSPPLMPAGTSKRRALVQANAPEVVTTDMIRPDWETKLETARSHAARRAAAATALHTAAFLIGGHNAGSSTAGSSSGGFPGRRLIRRAREAHGSESPSPNASGTHTPQDGRGTVSSLLSIGSSRRDERRERDEAQQSVDERLASLGFGLGSARDRERERERDRERERESPRNGGGLLNIGSTSSRRSRIVDLEEMMFMEAVRLSLVEEEERKEREAKKEEESRREQEEKEMARQRAAVAASVPSDPEGKGKSVERIATPTVEPSNDSAPSLPPMLLGSTSLHPGGSATSSSSNSFTSVPDQREETGTNNSTPDAENPNSAHESMFNFRSLAEMITVEEGSGKGDEKSEHVEHIEQAVQTPPVETDDSNIKKHGTPEVDVKTPTVQSANVVNISSEQTA